MSESNSESSSQRIPQPPRDPKLPQIIHHMPGMDRESLEYRKKVTRARSWGLLSGITGGLLIGMALGILATVLSPSKGSTVYVLQLDHGNVNSSLFLKGSEQAHLPAHVRLGMSGYCSSEDENSKRWTCAQYGKDIHWDNATEIYSTLLNKNATDLVMPPTIQNKTREGGYSTSTSGLSSDGQIIASPVMHGFSLLLVILSLGALGYRSSATVHIWLTFGALTLLIISFLMSGVATLGDTWGVYTQVTKGLHSYGVQVKPGFGFRTLFYLLNVFDFATVVLMVLAISVFLS